MRINCTQQGLLYPEFTVSNLHVVVDLGGWLPWVFRNSVAFAPLIVQYVFVHNTVV